MPSLALATRFAERSAEEWRTLILRAAYISPQGKPIGGRSALAAVILLTAGLLPSAAFPESASTIVGLARISDGDTVEIGTTKVRLNGIDAPESEQVCLDGRGKRWGCGQAARDALQRHAGGKPWTCKPIELDRYGRTIASCTVAGDDVNRWMVRHGWAMAFVRYSRIYEADEKAARDGKAGLWAGAFIAPWDWRARTTDTVILGAGSVPVNARAMLNGPQTVAAPNPSCAIKGNLRRDGECIYHLPGGRWYAKVDMDKGRGKRWFCSAPEAEAAGCRVAKP